jgi:hypothetical protein
LLRKLPNLLRELFSWVKGTPRLLSGFFAWARDKCNRLTGCITGMKWLQGYQSTPDSGSTDAVGSQDPPTDTGDATDEKEETVGSSWSRRYLSRRYLRTYLKREQEDAERSLQRKMDKKFEALEVALEDDLEKINDTIETKVDTIKTEMNEKLDKIMELLAAPTPQQPAVRPLPVETSSTDLERSETLPPKASPRGSKMILPRGKSSKASFS